MERKLDILLAIWRTECNKCHEEALLYIPISEEYSLLCEKCMVAGGFEVDHEATKRNLGGLYPKK